MSTPCHDRQGPSGSRELSRALMITVGFMVVEMVAGLLSGSLALLADAGHMLTDASALSLSLFAAWISTKPATAEKTYGYYRTEILAALVNGVALWLLVAWIGFRALHRLHHPTPIRLGPMLIAGGLGLLANLASSQILARARCWNLNLRGAQLHVFADALGSCGVLIAGTLIWWRGWLIADAFASLFIGLLIGLSSWVLITQSVHVLLEGVPPHLNLQDITRAMRQIRGVREVHDVHLWTITTGLEAMSGHVIVETLSDGPVILQHLERLLSERFGITHTTFQLEPKSSATAQGKT